MKTDHQVAEEIFSQCFRIADPYLLGTVASLVSGTSIVCSALRHEKEGITVGELAKYASVAPSRITAILDDFESKGFVKRFSKEGDRLHIYAKFTESGMEEAENNQKGLIQWIEGLIQHIGQEKMLEFTQTLLEIAAYAKGEKDHAETR